MPITFQTTEEERRAIKLLKKQELNEELDITASLELILKSAKDRAGRRI